MCKGSVSPLTLAPRPSQSQTDWTGLKLLLVSFQFLLKVIDWLVPDQIVFNFREIFPVTLHLHLYFIY